MRHLPLFLAFAAGTSLSIAYAATAALSSHNAEKAEPVPVECNCECQAPPTPAPVILPTGINDDEDVASELGVNTPLLSGAASGVGQRVPAVRQARAEVKGSLDKDIIRRIVRAHINDVRSCYNQGLTKNPNLQGRVAITWTIDKTGKVTESKVQESSVEDPAVAPCIADAVKTWKFPKPKGGGQVVVTYPFNLSPG
jgi:TonB family protein